MSFHFHISGDYLPRHHSTSAYSFLSSSRSNLSSLDYVPSLLTFYLPSKFYNGHFHRVFLFMRVFNSILPETTSTSQLAFLSFSTSFENSTYSTIFFHLLFHYLPRRLLTSSSSYLFFLSSPRSKSFFVRFLYPPHLHVLSSQVS